MISIRELAAPHGSVGNDNTLTIDYPRGRRVRTLELSSLRASDVAQTRTIMKTELSEINVRANGHLLLEQMSATDLFAINDYHGDAGADSAADDSVLRVSFVDPYAKPFYPAEGGVIDGESLAVGGVGLESLQAEVQLGTLDATNPMVRLRPSCSLGETNEEPGLVRRFVRHNESGWGTVKKGLTLVKRPGEVLRRIHITGYGSGVISQVEVYQAGQLVQRYYAADLARRAKEMQGTPQSGYYHLELGRKGHVLDGLNMDPKADPQVQITWSTAPDSNVFRWVGDFSTEFATLSGGAASR